MIIYKDALSNDDIISDSYVLKEVDGVVYEVDCKMISIPTQSTDIGHNPSMEGEEGEEGDFGDNTPEMVIDVIHNFSLNSIVFNKKDYMAYLKGWFRALRQKAINEGGSGEEISSKETSLRDYSKKILADFNNFQFYLGESMNPEGMVVLLNYRDDGVTPYVTIWKHGLVKNEA